MQGFCIAAFGIKIVIIRRPIENLCTPMQQQLKSKVMYTVKSYKCALDTSSKKFICCNCGKKSFVKIIDTETKQYLPDHVGRCDRQNECGYQYTHKQYLTETDKESYSRKDFSYIAIEKNETAKPIDFIPIRYVEYSITCYDNNNLIKFLKLNLGEQVTIELCRRYLIGTSIHWNGSTIFWQFDEIGNVRQLKIILYDPITGKRIKKGASVERYYKHTKTFVKGITEVDCSKVYGKYLPGVDENANLVQCFFGQHLLTEYPESEVCIVESEKTALIASIYFPNFIWLATGGASGCKWREYQIYKVLENRHVTFFPDHGYYNKNKNITCYQEWTERVKRISEAIKGNFKVSDILEKKLTERKDQDLADLLLK